jgi:hypothetical protein
MKKHITLSADAGLIAQARRQAAADHTTLNKLFSAWLERYVSQPEAADRYDRLMQALAHVQASRSFTREEMNERCSPRDPSP